jgi:hypothetical protein
MSKWIELEEERRGAIKNKVWMTDGKRKALFKPDTAYNESCDEIDAYRIGRGLGIDCAITEGAEINGVKGILSYDFKEPGYIYVPVGNAYRTSSALVANSHDSDGMSLKRADNLSLNEVRNNPKFKPIEKGMVDMLFLDCLIDNGDRHGNNWELKFSNDGKQLLGIAPLFDHGISQGDYDYSMVKIDKDEGNPSHLEMFKFLSVHYPEQINGLMEKARLIPFGEFCRNRFQQMKEVFLQTKAPRKQSLDSLIKKAEEQVSKSSSKSDKNVEREER